MLCSYYGNVVSARVHESLPQDTKAALALKYGDLTFRVAAAGRSGRPVVRAVQRGSPAAIQILSGEQRAALDAKYGDLKRVGFQRFKPSASGKAKMPERTSRHPNVPQPALASSAAAAAAASAARPLAALDPAAGASATVGS
eukprot:3703845-Prymnesium_polylepis.1